MRLQITPDKLFGLALLAAVSLLPGQANALIFSVDPASPLIGTNTTGGVITPDDLLAPGPNGPVVVKQGRDMGLKDDFYNGNFDNLDAVSKGDDYPPWKYLYFSVDRVSVGLPGSDVYDQAQPGVEEAAGDIYRTPPYGSNKLVIDEEQLGLKSGFFGDDLDALDWTSDVSSPLYFSIDELSASNDGAGCKAANIYRDVFPVVQHYYFQMGLTCSDDLDALVYDAIDDIALFSLSPFSALTFTYTGYDYQPGIPEHLSPADILFTRFDGTFSLWKSAAEIGLFPGDNVDALEVPEPGTVLLMVTGLFGLWRTDRVFGAMAKYKAS